MPKDLDLPKGCNRCHSAPFVVSSSGGAERCNCARGRQLYELDQERKAPDLRPERRRAWRRPGRRIGRRAAAMLGRPRQTTESRSCSQRPVRDAMAVFHLRR